MIDGDLELRYICRMRGPLCSPILYINLFFIAVNSNSKSCSSFWKNCCEASLKTNGRIDLIFYGYVSRNSMETANMNTFSRFSKLFAQ